MTPETKDLKTRDSVVAEESRMMTRLEAVDDYRVEKEEQDEAQEWKQDEPTFRGRKQADRDEHEGYLQVTSDKKAEVARWHSGQVENPGNVHSQAERGNIIRERRQWHKQTMSRMKR
jgi:hypothetical protein